MRGGSFDEEILQEDDERLIRKNVFRAVSAGETFPQVLVNNALIQTPEAICRTERPGGAEMPGTLIL
jgi:hypothetical protein